MANSSSTATHLYGFITRQRLLAVFALISVWTIADLLPKYKATIRTSIVASTSHLPSVKIDYHPNLSASSKFNQTKLAVIIESRPLPHLVPQLLHMISVVPPDWRFLFLGSDASVLSVGRAPATQVQQADGKLDVKKAPEPWDIASREGIYRMLTDTRFYDEMLPGVEWMLKFEADSILCANSKDSLNHWLDYSWAGAPMHGKDRFAGNGGLTLRRISAIKQVLGFQSRYNDTQPEDEWFGKRMTVLPGALVANAEQDDHFAIESVWHEKEPMGYHIPEGGTRLPEDVWKSSKHRKQIFAYCPELSMIMPMKLERERCGARDPRRHG